MHTEVKCKNLQNVFCKPLWSISVVVLQQCRQLFDILILLKLLYCQTEEKAMGFVSNGTNVPRLHSLIAGTPGQQRCPTPRSQSTPWPVLMRRWPLCARYSHFN